MRRTIIVSALVLAVMVALVCVEYSSPDKGLPRSQSLGDGSVLTVEAVSFGTNHLYREHRPWPWQLAIGKRLPYALAASLAWRFDTTDWASIANPAGWISLAVFAKREGTGRGQRDNIRVVVLDESGNSPGWDDGGQRGLQAGPGPDPAGAYYHTLRSWHVPAFPRRGKSVTLRFLRDQGNGHTGVPIMQVRVPNPQPGPYPIWTPEPWPATKEAGDLSVTLTDFTTGLSRSQPTRAAVENEPVVTRLALALVAQGRTNCPWQVKFIEVSDATSNHWIAVPMGLKSNASQQGVTNAMTLSGNLWPGESAWKLRIELSPAADVPPDDLTTLAGLPVPPQGSNAPLALSTNIGGFPFRLQKIETTKASAKSNGLTVPVSISYEIQGMPDGCHLILLNATDDQERNFAVNASSGFWQSGKFDLAVPPDAVRLNCTFGLRRSRFVEFVAKPRRP